MPLTESTPTPAPLYNPNDAAANGAGASQPTSFFLVYFGKTPSDLQVKELLFRGDTRHPSEIFKQGFTAPGTSTCVYRHVQGYASETSAYISTSTSKEVAARFPKFLGQDQAFIYEINTQRKAINIERKLQADLQSYQLEEFKYYIAEKEMAVPFKIKPNDIKGAWLVRLEAEKTNFGTPWESTVYVRTTTDTYLSNPDYLPPGSTFLKTAKAVGHGVKIVGALLDSMSLHQAYQDSHQTGDYDIFFREGARIIGGWTGAAAVGIAFAEIGAVTGSGFGPIGTAVGGVGGGIVGSVVGYVGGGTLATNGFNAVANNTQSQVRTTSTAQLVAEAFSKQASSIESEYEAAYQRLQQYKLFESDDGVSPSSPSMATKSPVGDLRNSFLQSRKTETNYQRETMLPQTTNRTTPALTTSLLSQQQAPSEVHRFFSNNGSATFDWQRTNRQAPPVTPYTHQLLSTSFFSSHQQATAHIVRKFESTISSLAYAPKSYL